MVAGSQVDGAAHSRRLRANLWSGLGLKLPSVEGVYSSYLQVPGGSCHGKNPGSSLKLLVSWVPFATCLSGEYRSCFRCFLGKD